MTPFGGSYHDVDPEAAHPVLHRVDASPQRGLWRRYGVYRRHNAPPCVRSGDCHGCHPYGECWASANRLVLGQLKVDGAIQRNHGHSRNASSLLDLKGAVVTMDAMGCQKEMAKTMTEQEADDVLALKDKHQTLSEAVTLLLTDARDTGFADYRARLPRNRRWGSRPH